MTNYTATFLKKKGISFCKKICKDLSITPNGDKRCLNTWIAAVLESQEVSTPVELPTAVITYDDSLTGVCEGDYCIVADGAVIHRTRSYMSAERFCSGKYQIVVDTHQQELEQELEDQVQRISLPQSPVFLQDDYNYTHMDIDFGYTEVMFKNQHIGTVSRNFDNWLWYVDDVHKFETYQEAYDYVLASHRLSRFLSSSDERGSGRVAQLCY